eukprot:2525121-Prymnesium_polylepis.1
MSERDAVTLRARLSHAPGPACPSAAGARTTGERTRKSGDGSPLRRGAEWWAIHTKNKIKNALPLAATFNRSRRVPCRPPWPMADGGARG